MSKRYHCLKCNEDAVYVYGQDSHHYGCGGRVIPIATICDPPEPTVIDESDLAPGMVVVAVDVAPYSLTLLCAPDVRLLAHGETWALRMTMIEHVDASDVAWVAKGRPC